jgi:hypothetical protein
MSMIDFFDLQDRVFSFGVKAFGLENMADPKMRCLRLAEEAVEAAQVYGVEKEKLHLLIDLVYSRPIGEARREVSQIGMTWIALVHSQGYLGDLMVEQELRRCLAKHEKDPTAFKKRNQEKVDMGLRVD